MNSKYLIKTTNGFKEFDGIVKSQYKEGLKIYFDDNSFISVTKNHRFVDKELKLAQDLKVNDIINNKKIIKIENIISEFYDPFGVHGDNTYLVNGLNNHNCNIILIDECVEYNEKIKIRDKFFKNEKLIKIGDLYQLKLKADFIFEKFKKINFQNKDLLFDYIFHCLFNSTNEKIKYKTDNHHILPKSIFPEFENEDWNKVNLFYKDHFFAHYLLAQVFTDQNSILFAWNSMCNKLPSFKTKTLTIEEQLKLMDFDTYQKLKERAAKQLGDLFKNKTVVIDKSTNKTVIINSDEYQANKELYTTHSTNKMTVIDKQTGDKIRINTDDYDINKHIFHTAGKNKYINLKTGVITLKEVKFREEYDFDLKTFIIIERNGVREIIKSKYFNINTDIFIERYKRPKNVTYKKPKKEKKILKHIKKIKNIKVPKYILQAFKKEKSEKQQKNDLRRKNYVLCKEGNVNFYVTKDDFKNKNYNGLNKGKIYVYNKITNKYNLIEKHLFDDKIHIKKSPPNCAKSGSNNTRSKIYQIFDTKENLIYENFLKEFVEFCQLHYNLTYRAITRYCCEKRPINGKYFPLASEFIIKNRSKNDV